jgi:lipoyl(octanoyl) transferase
MPRFLFKDVGLISYNDALQLQKQLLQKRIQQQCPDTVLLLEHTPVFTLGRRAKIQNILRNYDPDRHKILDADVVKTDRGGDITFHGPGQLIIYPIIALKINEQKLKPLLSCYEEIIIRPLKSLGADLFRVKGKTGVWSHNGKLASIGIAIKRWTTFHGIALNVSTDLSYFDHIIPCGLRDCNMINLNSIINQNITVDQIKKIVIDSFEDTWTNFPF